MGLGACKKFVNGVLQTNKTLSSDGPNPHLLHINITDLSHTGTGTVLLAIQNFMKRDFAELYDFRVDEAKPCK